MRQALRHIRANLAEWRRTRRAPGVSVNLLPSLAFFLLPGGERTGTFRLSGVPFAVRKKDWCAVQEVLFRGEYDFVADLLQGNHTPRVVDLGANVGLFSLKVYSLCRRGQFLLVEPSLATFRVLEMNTRLNPGMQSRIHRAAVWTENGSIPFYEDPGTSTAATLTRKPNTTAASTVPCATLSTLLQDWGAERVDVLKMDIEGAEEAVLRQSRGPLALVDALIIEIHPQQCNLPGVIALLRGAYQRVYEVAGRQSSKPLVLATNRVLSLPPYEGNG